MTLFVCRHAVRFRWGMQYLVETSIVAVQWTVLCIRFAISLIGEISSYTCSYYCFFSRNVFKHRDSKLAGLSLTHNLQWHFVYADMRRDFCEEWSIWYRHVLSGYNGQYYVYALQLASLFGESNSKRCVWNKQSCIDDMTSLVMHVTRPLTVTIPLARQPDLFFQDTLSEHYFGW